MISYDLIGKYNNRLIITNNLNKITYFNNYKNDIITLKQLVITEKEKIFINIRI